MIKILIVDDEIPIREWLKDVINSIPDVYLVAAVSNGEDAFLEYQGNCPDIVITDIKMPLMDGIELLKRIRATGNNVYVVMLTSHNDFHYARDSLKYHADEYILKSEISKDTIANIIKRYTTTHTSEQTEPTYIGMIIKKDLPNATLDKKSNGFWTALAFYSNDSDYHSLQKYFNETIELYKYDENISICLFNMEKVVSASDYDRTIYTACNTVMDLFKTSVGRSKQCRDKRIAVKQSVETLARSFYDERNRIINYHVQEDSLEQKIKLLRDTVILSISKNNLDEAWTEAKELLSLVKDAEYTNINLLLTCMFDFYNALKFKMFEKGLINIDDMFIYPLSEERSKQTFRNVSNAVNLMFENVNVIKAKEIAHYSKHIKSAMDYTRDHYNTITSLQEVCNHIGLNLEYFCRLFKMETGETYNSYLTRFRIGKAEEYLLNTDMKVYEISVAVGYSNFSYFTKVFKKTTGKNPSDYRE